MTLLELKAVPQVHSQKSLKVTCHGVALLLQGVCLSNMQREWTIMSLSLSTAVLAHVAGKIEHFLSVSCPTGVQT